MNRETLVRARDDLRTFAEVVGYPLLGYQADALTLPTRMTVVVAPRQTGKSYSLSVLALWTAFRKPRQRVLLVSAGEDASKRLLSSIASVAQSPLLKGSVLNETASVLTLSNGSEIRSVPASERQIRGWSVDLLVVDEAAYVADDVLLGAALPTTAARPDARIVLCSTPWATTGAFYRLALQGMGNESGVRTYRWALRDAPWITDEVVEQYRQTLAPLRFRAEFDGEFVGASDAVFPLSEIQACVADYALLPASEARGEEVVVGLDWGKMFDRHATVLIGVLEDYGRNETPVLFVPFLETSTRPYTEQIGAIYGLMRKGRRAVMTLDPPFFSRPIRETLPGGFVLHESGRTLPNPAVKVAPGYTVVRVATETNGVGQMPSEELARRLGRRVVATHSSQKSKEDNYARLRALISDRRIVLPDSLDLIRQIAGITQQVTPTGGLRIGAADENTHDDLVDALTLAVAAMPVDTSPSRAAEEPRGIEWIETQGGVSVPRHPRPRRRGAFRRSTQRITTW